MEIIPFIHGQSNYADLKAGDIVSFSGVVFTARDAAHARIAASIAAGTPLPFDLRGSVIYYAGPTPTRDGQVIGSCGPTTSARMDDYTPLLLSHGLAAMIGKGKRDADVVAAIKKFGAVYFLGVGGAAALVSRHITECRDIAYPDLDCEAVRRLRIDNLELLVGIDSRGESILK